MPRIAWTLTDYSTGSAVTYNFPINPNDHEPAGRKSSTATDRATSPNGIPIIFQGRDQVVGGAFSGAILDQAMYNSLRTWANKWYPLVLVDDAGLSWDILITDFSIKRLKRRNAFRYDYTIKYLEVS